MKFQKTKQTKRFQYQARINPTSHQAGANTVTITTKDYDVNAGRGYSFDAMIDGTVTMSVREARALQNFLNSAFPVSSVPSDSTVR